MKPVWRLSAGQLLDFRSWDDECVLYNNLSGSTHLIGAASLHLLQCLRGGAADVDALVDALRAEFDTEPGADLAGDVAGLLDDLSGFSLIERCQ
jgi:PqqD family protein of HPr-rel-A system